MIFSFQVTILDLTWASLTTLASEISPKCSKCFRSSLVVTSGDKSPTNIWWSSEMTIVRFHNTFGISLTGSIFSNAIRSCSPIHFYRFRMNISPIEGLQSLESIFMFIKCNEAIWRWIWLTLNHNLYIDMFLYSASPHV